jgi:hypothetical protein
VIYDELGSADNRAVRRHGFCDGRAGNRLMLVISTQAADDFAPMSQLVDYGLHEADIRDPAFHLTLTRPRGRGPVEQKARRAANPALGDFRSLADVERMASRRSVCPRARTPSVI